MSALIDQVVLLLASEEGRLVYHLILAFSIAGALQIALIQGGKESLGKNRRWLFGLGLLIAIQIALFISSGLAWRGVVDGRLWLALFDRSAALISLVVIVWLWSFPESDPGADAAALIGGSLALIGSIFASLWWIRTSQAGGTYAAMLNGSPIDVTFQIAALLICAFGMLIIAVLKPAGGGFGLTMLALLACGHIAHLALPYDGDYPLAVRLFEIAAFPLLLVIPLRSQLRRVERPLDLVPAGMIHAEDGASRLIDWALLEQAAGISVKAESEFLESVLGLMDDLPEEQVCMQVAAALAEACKAEAVFMHSAFDGRGRIHISCGYSKGADRFYAGKSLDPAAMPMAVSSLRLGRIRKLSSAHSSTDRLTLGRAFSLEHVGAMLFVPVLGQTGKALAGAILVGGEFRPDWTQAEQTAAVNLTRFFFQFLQRSRKHETLQTELDLARQSTRRAQDLVQKALEDDRKLRDQIAALQESRRRDQEKIMKMSALLNGQMAAQEALDRSKEETLHIKETLGRLEGGQALQGTPWAAEMRLLLEEIAVLRDSVADADRRLSEADAARAAPEEPPTRLPSTQRQTILEISDELQEPLASIGSYTDMLLEKTAGDFEPEKRRYLERIKLAVGRMEWLLEELARLSSASGDEARVERKEIDLIQVIQQAVKETNGIVNLRKLTLKLAVPDQPVVIDSDPDLIYRVIAQLLRNACTVSPEGGEIGLRALLESRPGERDYALVQITDQGGGIDPALLPRVFSAPPGGEHAHPPIPGLAAKTVDFPRLHALMEALGGRIWVDSELGEGTTFNVLIPASENDDPGSSNPAGESE